jgi:hypothetical protein
MNSPPAVFTQLLEAIHCVAHELCGTARMETSFRDMLHHQLRALVPHIQSEYIFPVHALLDGVPVQYAVHRFDLFCFAIPSAPDVGPVVLELKVGTAPQAEAQTTMYLESMRKEYRRQGLPSPRLLAPWGITVRFAAANPTPIVQLHNLEHTWIADGSTWKLHLKRVHTS